MSRRSISDLAVKLFADGANKVEILALCKNPLIQGFTTNPTLMRRAGVANYERFARELLDAITDRPISLEVFSDDFADMRRQACKISQWGANVYVKIPVMNTAGECSNGLVRELAWSGVRVNVTALLSLDQVRCMAEALAGGPPCVISVFAGRIADTGSDPVPLMAAARKMVGAHPNIQLLWASCRELLNIFQANDAGCHIITVTNDVLKKLSLVGKDLEELSRDTVAMFREDAVRAGYSL